MAIKRMEAALAAGVEGRYHFPCRKALLFVRLLGASTPLRYAAPDNVCFRIDQQGFIVEDVNTHIVRRKFAWLDIENLAIGEPESDNSDLFQG